MNELLKEYPLIKEIPVAWGEMDAFQHVNNIIYLRYFESSRIAYFEKLDYMQIMERTKIGPILGATQCKFRFPLTYPDTVSVGAKVVDILEDRMVMKHIVVSQRHQKLAADGEATIVAYNYLEKRKTQVPEMLKKRILELEATIK